MAQSKKQSWFQRTFKPRAAKFRWGFVLCFWKVGFGWSPWLARLKWYRVQRDPVFVLRLGPAWVQLGRQ